MLALVLACLLALLPASLIGWQVLEGIRDRFGEAYVRNLTQVKRQAILAPVSRDLALSRRLADSVLLRQWLRDEDDPAKKSLLFEEAEGYRKDFRDHSYFLASAANNHLYFNDDSKPFSDQPRYTLDPTKASDSWFPGTLARTDDYNINVDHNINLQLTMVWINVVVRDGGRKVGAVGTGVNLGIFLADFIAASGPDVTPIIINETGAIQAHRNQSLIALNVAGTATDPAQTLAGQLPEGPQRQALAAAMAEAVAHPGEVATLHASLDGKEQVLALSYIPELKWHTVTAVDLRAAQFLDTRGLDMAAAAFAALLVILLLAFGYAVERLVLRPLRNLQYSASAMARGEFDVSLPTPGQDEIGDLSRAFGVMAGQVRTNTDELEHKVQARTQALEQANRDMLRAHSQINDSIDYASLIQRAILPDQELRHWLGTDHFVFWRPRDVVGGDFYIFRAEGPRYLIGVVDCAGHGVPGALMTMLARSALDHAMGEAGIDSPAAILRHADSAMRGMLREGELHRAIATNMDMGLALIDRDRRSLRYAGARISLYWSDGEQVGEIKGARRAIADRRQGVYQDSEIALLPGVTYYLATDGFLDQAGGEFGFGFGNTRFAQLLQSHAHLPMERQAEALDQALEAYQGGYPQRDDITILSFRFG